MTTKSTTKSINGKIISICSAKGGVGNTVLAVNLAVCLARRKKKVALVDGCFQFGNVHLMLNMHPIITIKDLAEKIDKIENNSIISYMSKHESGVHFLSAPLKPEFADLINVKAVEKMCKYLRESFDYVVIDTRTGLCDFTLSFIENADSIITITDLEMSTLKNTKSMLSILKALGLRQKVKILVNRSNMKSLLKLKDVNRILNESNLLSIPNNFNIVSKSINIGVPFVMQYRRKDISKELYNITDIIVNEFKERDNNESS